MACNHAVFGDLSPRARGAHIRSSRWRPVSAASEAERETCSRPMLKNILSDECTFFGSR